ncbi:MAG: single-stranded-DNA-specific exonuclease RecJ [Gammaproteobacteria bacterium]|nr:single-stranded-DNA-specific exonuclease RecJ [Gammaproteobacteria bacterium]
MFLKSITRRSALDIPDSLSGLDPVLQRIYTGRNIKSIEEVDLSMANLLDFHELKNIELAATTLADIIMEQQSVVIVGDFDADGATSTALLMLAFKEFGLSNVCYVVPNRFDYGYGLSPEIVDEVAKLNPDWIITVDNGISSFEGVQKAKEHGIKVMVTDHHLPPEKLPEAEVILNPNQDGDNFSSKSLAGVGVAFYLLIGLRAELRRRDYFNSSHIIEPNLAQWLDLVALGTVADVVPLDRNNRIIVSAGLERIRRGHCRPAIRLLLQIAKRNAATIQASDLGFAVGPRLNAAGRLEDMSVGIESLLANTEQEALPLVTELDNLNHYRREREQEMLEHANQQVEHQLAVLQHERPNALCLYSEDWHQGIVGLVASRIKEKLNRPVIAFAKENEMTLKGSGRSVAGIHLRDALANVARLEPEILPKFGGHAMAAGLSINKADFSKFSSLFENEINRLVTEQCIDDTIYTDGALSASDFNLEFSELLNQAGPWGQNFPEPIFDNQFEVINQSIVGNKHLKFVLGIKEEGKHKSLDAIYFFPPEDYLNQRFQKVEVVYKLSINEFRGEKSLQAIIEQIKEI